MRNISVSIIVAVYNVGKYIDKCIKSLVDQNYENIEIILVDDGSLDNSPKVCDDWALKDTRIRVIHKKNGGLADARNEGLNAANGEYVCFVDGDDFIEKELVCQTYTLAKTDDVDVVIYSNYDVASNGMKTRHDLIFSKNVYRGKEDILQLFKESIGTMPNSSRDFDIGYAPWGKLYRRSVLVDNDIKFKSERKLIYEDLMFLLDLMPYIKSASVTNQPLYNYCRNELSLTRSVDTSRFYRIKNQYYYLKNNDPYKEELFLDKEILLRFKRTMISYIRNCAMRAVNDKKINDILGQICYDEMTREIVNDYPILKLPRNQAIFAFCIKYKLLLLLKIILNLKLKKENLKN